MSICLKDHYFFIPLIHSLFLFLLKPETPTVVKLNLCQKITAAGIMEYLRSNKVEIYPILWVFTSFTRPSCFQNDRKVYANWEHKKEKKCLKPFANFSRAETRLFIQFSEMSCSAVAKIVLKIQTMKIVLKIHTMTDQSILPYTILPICSYISHVHT